jgi:hypothetical protein
MRVSRSSVCTRCWKARLGNRKSKNVLIAPFVIARFQFIPYPHFV